MPRNSRLGPTPGLRLDLETPVSALFILFHRRSHLTQSTGDGDLARPRWSSAETGLLMMLQEASKAGAVNGGPQQAQDLHSMEMQKQNCGCWRGEGTGQRPAESQ